jgi:hypothetical protein
MPRKPERLPDDARCEELLGILRKSDLLSPDFPKRLRYTHAEWAVLDHDRRQQIHDPGLAAIERVKNCSVLQDYVSELGRARYSAGVPLLAALWANCGLSPVRNWAGHALRAIGTTEAREALRSLIDDADLFATRLAVLAVFDANAANAFDHFQPYFDPARITQPGGAAIPNSVLSILLPDTFTTQNGKSIPNWTEVGVPAVPVLLRDDPRWIALCMTLRRHEQLGARARRVLRYADPALVRAALEQARARETPHVVKIETRSSGNLLARYLRGECVPVWNELRAHEALGGDLLAEAQAVARETMLRVARNADLLAERLDAVGWIPLYGALRTKPKAQDREIIRRIEDLTGAPLPLSLRAFWEIVGGINFVWDYNEDGAAPNLGVRLDLPLPEMDLLCVDSPETVTHVFEVWEDQKSEIDPELTDPFCLDLAPDDLHKMNVSGGPAYGIELPFPGADPIFANEVHNLPFVDYLRLCFRWAGFPSLEDHGDRADVRQFLQAMSKGLEPF